MKIPLEAQSVCIFAMSAMIVEAPQSVFFRRAAGKDELWSVTHVAASDPASLADTADAQTHDCAAEGTVLDGCERLVRKLLLHYAGFVWPSGFIQAGLLDEAGFSRIVRQLEAEFKATRAAGLAHGGSPIVTAARQLGLGPRPGIQAAGLWEATCPGTNHHLLLDAPGGNFFCGYCRKKGGPAELAGFVAERAKPKGR